MMLGMKTLIQKISILGLKEKETCVYSSLLSMSKGTVTDIAVKTGIKRTSVYQHLESLLKKDFISQTVSGKRVFYTAEDPQKILSFLTKKETEIQNIKKTVEKILPELKDLYKNSFSRPNIRFFRGKEGVKKVYEEMAISQKNIYSFFSPRRFFKVFSQKENDEILMRLFKNGGTIYNLIERSSAATERLKLQKYHEFVMSKMLPGHFTFSSDILIGKDMTAFISFDSLIAIVIEDDGIARLQKNIFMEFWKNLR